jgi:uncharacterized protein YndB with AHSA1/START domain
VEGRELVVERIFQAPRALVFQAFSAAEHLKHWWGPRGWEVVRCTVDFRPGGTWHYGFMCKDPQQADFYGVTSWGKAIYREIVPVEKIVYVDYFSDEEGNISDEMPAGTTTLLFLEQDGKTRLVTRVRYETEEALRWVLGMGMEQGYGETLDRLEAYMRSVD